MPYDKITLIAAIVGVAGGVTGTVLGIINTWRQIRGDRVRIRVIPAHAILTGRIENAPWNFVIEAVNLSEFPVYVEDVGFLLGNGKRATIAPMPGLEPHGALPVRLEPRASYSKFFKIDRAMLQWRKVKFAYVSTKCGITARGSSAALKQIKKDWGAANA